MSKRRLGTIAVILALVLAAGLPGCKKTPLDTGPDYGAGASVPPAAGSGGSLPPLASAPVESVQPQPTSSLAISGPVAVEWPLTPVEGAPAAAAGCDGS